MIRQGPGYLPAYILPHQLYTKQLGMRPATAVNQQQRTMLTSIGWSIYASINYLSVSPVSTLLRFFVTGSTTMEQHPTVHPTTYQLLYSPGIACSNSFIRSTVDSYLHLFPPQNSLQDTLPEAALLILSEILE